MPSVSLVFLPGSFLAVWFVTSPTLYSFNCHAVEAYRLAIWIGIRSQLYRATLPIVSHVLHLVDFSKKRFLVADTLLSLASPPQGHPHPAYHFPELLHTYAMRFLVTTDLFAPAFIGELFSTASILANLAESVANVIPVQPVNWDLAVAKAKDVLPRDNHVQILALVRVGLKVWRRPFVISVSEDF